MTGNLKYIASNRPNMIDRFLLSRYKNPLCFISIYYFYLTYSIHNIYLLCFYLINIINTVLTTKFFICSLP